MNALTYAETDQSIRSSLVEPSITLQPLPMPDRLLPARGLVLGLAAAALFWIVLATIVVKLV